MSSFEDLMNESRRLQKELEEKSSLDEYKRNLEATLVMDDDSPAAVATPSLSLVDNSFTAHSPVTSTDADDEVAKIDQRDDSMLMMAKEMTTATPLVEPVSVIPSETYNAVTEIDDSHVPSSEFPLFKDPPVTEMAMPSSRQMATLIIPPSTVTPDVSYKPSLKEIQDRVHKERGLMFEDRPIPVDPKDSRRLATPLSRAKSRGSFVHQSTPSADLVALQREMAEKHNNWMAQMEADELAKKKSWATLAYEDSLENSPTPVPVPMMPGYHSLVGPSLATNSTFQLPLDVVSGVTERNPASLVIDMRTDRGMAITAGLVGAGM
jgi:hypothetical protein